jgi:serine/threonine protein kinase/tetratricopeptide (TPR) repeat protein
MTEPLLPEESLFAQALELKSAAERAAFLDRACADNPALRAEVEALLRAHEWSGDLLDLPEHQPATTDQSAGEHPGTLVGPYKLLEQVGEGGMGTVWMAEQTEPIRRRVAVKVVKEGMDSRQFLARFEAERQALALMEHPNIAKVLDAGRTASGRPYFVMELVKGQPITKYCDAKRLGVRERLNLFGEICGAVQHAHQKGIIHRDLKPSNVLVAPYDGKPVVKVIDFGVAKATGQRLTERTLFTGFGALVGTPEYMSPEQAEVNNQDIDTRSDIYALGVLLYELLAGSTPLTRQRVKEAALLEVLRVIREEEPPRPSTRLSESKDSLPSISAQRQMEPAKLTRLVRGELDWIVMKALEKDRSRRYETANGFAHDVQRYLADEPVLACPPSLGYRLRKTARRHKALLTAAAAMLGLLLAGTAVSAWQAVRATRAEQETENALEKVTDEQGRTQDALTAARDTLDTLTDDVVAKTFARQPELDETEKAYLRKVLAFYETVAQQLGDTPETQFLRAKGYFNVGLLLGLLGETRRADASYLHAVNLLTELKTAHPEVPEYRRTLATACRNRAVLLVELGQEVEAESSFRRSLQLRQELADQFRGLNSYYRLALARIHSDLANLLRQRKQFAESESAYREVIRELSKRPAQPDVLTEDLWLLAHCRSNLGTLLWEQGRLGEAQEEYRLALKFQEEQVARSPITESRRELADTYYGLGIVLSELSKQPDGEQTLRHSLALREKLVQDYPNVSRFRGDLAGGYQALGHLFYRSRRWVDARIPTEKAVECWQSIVARPGSAPASSFNLSESYRRLGIVLAELGKSDEAEKAFQQGLTLDEKLVKEFPQNAAYRRSLASGHGCLAKLFRDSGQAKRVESALRQARLHWKRLAEDSAPQLDDRSELVGTLGNLAAVHRERGEFAAAVRLLDQALPHSRACLEAAPKNAKYRLYHYNTLLTLAHCLVKLPDHARLATTAGELADDGHDPANDAYLAACMLCSCHKLAGQDSTLTEVRRSELRERYAEKAMSLLQRAVTHGFADTDQLRSNPGLEPLRARKDFCRLLAQLMSGCRL